MRKQIERLLQHPIYQKRLALLQELEGNRIYCGHDLSHFFAVGRIAETLSKENHLSHSNDVLWASALLHDMGRVEQYQQGISHDKASVAFAREILLSLGWDQADMELVCEAIGSHSKRFAVKDRWENRTELRSLAEVLSFADHFSRKCYECKGADSCKWPEEERINQKFFEEEIMKIGQRQFDEKGKTYVMGIMNVTPDSFSDGGNYTDMDAMLFHAREMIEDGVDIIDVGGESTRPGYTMISDEEEIQRVCPAIELIKKEFDIPVSLDTYKSAVARAGISSGADMINDIWGLQYDHRMGAVVAESGVAYCLMHNRKEVNEHLLLKDFLHHMDEDFARAEEAGIDKSRILYDPGIGFAKTQEQNLMLIGNLDKMVAKAPVLLGTSRKSVINYVLDLPVDERVEGTLATTAEAVFAGVSMVRVHDVKENARFIKMLERTREKWVK